MTNKLFLLADDDIDDTEMFCEALEKIDSSFICKTTDNGRKLLEFLKDKDTLPSMIFLDINMPVMNGWECLFRLKRNEQYAHIPVVIMSTSSPDREQQIAADAGAAYYFTKPHDFDDLYEILKGIIVNFKF